MKKENVKVAVTDKEQAEMYRKVLVGLGETISRQYYPFTNCLTYSGGWYLSRLDNEEKQLITFGQLVDLLTRKPLLISEDGVELFEGDKLFEVTRIRTETDWNFNEKANYAKGYWTADGNKKARWFETPNYSKAFSTKQAALDWIEKMNKPKEIEVKLFNNRKCLIKQRESKAYEIEIYNYGALITVLFPSDIEDINHALSQLK